MTKENFSAISTINQDGCFDLQFRKDTRKERTNSPTYYRWRMQFVVTAQKTDTETLEKVKKEIGCGKISVSGKRAMLSVQKMEEIEGKLEQFFRKNLLTGNKKREYDLWIKAAEVIGKNRGKALHAWKKSDINALIEIKKTSDKYKVRTRKAKWLDMASTIGSKN